MAELPSMASQDRLPLVNYAKRHCWGNPQLNQQFQVRLARVSHSLGYVKNFSYMGKYYLLPEPNRFYNVFTLGGLNSGSYGFGSRVFHWAPFDRWVNAKEYIEKRGIILDFYNEKGLMYNRTETWIMQCFNGTTLVAFVKNDVTFPMAVEKPMYMRCYTPDNPNAGYKGYGTDHVKFEVSGITYYDFRDWDELKSIYNEYKSRGYGRLTVWHNGVYKNFEDIKPAVGDLIELFLDPTIERVVTFKYNALPNYYSNRDKKSKMILFPWLTNKEKRYYYFDDCEFYVYDRKSKLGVYLHRNNQDCVRQLTHQDYGVAGDYVETVANYLINNSKNKTTLSDIDVIVTYHRTAWNFTLGPTSSRIAELYLLEDATKIVNAMTGPKSTITEWQASNLENSPHNKLLGREFLDITNDDVYNALGYNGCSNVLSNPIYYMPGVMPGDSGFKNLYSTPNYLTGKGYLVPPTYRVSSTVYEYDSNGHLLRNRGLQWSEYYKPSKDAVFCEYALGEATTYLDATLTKSNFKVNSDYGFRVYRAPWKIGEYSEPEVVDKFWQYEWSISQDGQPLYQTDTVVNLPTQDADTRPDVNRPWDGGELGGPWEDITDNTEYYTFNKSTGVISWKMNMNNYVGMVVSDSKHLYFETELAHLDNSLSFSLIHLWKIGGVLLPIRPAQVDIWMEGLSLIENVDYIFDFPTIYIINKQHLVEGKKKYKFKVRATGLAKEGPLPRSELGFVVNGVLGYNGRYNVRLNRPTKTISNGRIFLTQSIDWAETKGHGNNFNGLEGFPYEVKHYVCLNKYVESYTSQKGLTSDEEKDVRISAYLGTYVSYKTNTPPKLPTVTDKYLVFSPFLSQLYNEMHLGFITIPSGTVTDQMVNLLSQHIQFLLEYDPCTLNFNDAYFEVHPCSNVGYQPITAKQLQILEKANELYLKGRVRVRGHFEIIK